jgi:hypothetical protein
LTFTETVQQVVTGTLSTAAGANRHFATASVTALFSNGIGGVDFTSRIVHTPETLPRVSINISPIHTPPDAPSGMAG